MPPASVVMLQVSGGQIPSNHWITRSCSSHEQQKKTSQQQQNFNSALSQLRYHDCMCAVVKGMKENVCFGSAHGLMKCQDETVSTSLCMCHYSFYVYKTQHVLMFGRLKTIDFLVISNLWLHVALLVFSFFPNIMRSVPLSLPTF